MVTFRILQIKDIASCDYAFRSYDKAKFKLEDYQVEYCYTVNFWDQKSDDYILDFIFQMFNTAIPEDFDGHSLSVSDLVSIERDNTECLYYCEPFGWAKVWNKVKENKK